MTSSTISDKWEIADLLLGLDEQEFPQFDVEQMLRELLEQSNSGEGIEINPSSAVSD